VLWSPDGSQLAFGSALYNVATAQVIGEHVCPGRWPPSDAFDCTGSRLEYYPEFWGERVQIYTDPKATTYRWIEPHESWTRAAALNPTGALLATSGQDLVRPAGSPPFATCPDCRVVHTTRVWEVSSFARLGQLPVGFDQLAFAMGDEIIVGITAGHLEAWDWRSARQVWVADLPAGRLEVSPNGEYVSTTAFGQGNTDITLWRAATGELVATLTGHTAPSREAWSRTSAYDVRWPFGIHLTSLAFSPDSTKLAAGSQDGTVMIWPVP
jgi:WD40 repeat protein